MMKLVARLDAGCVILNRLVEHRNAGGLLIDARVVGGCGRLFAHLEHHVVQVALGLQVGGARGCSHRAGDLLLKALLLLLKVLIVLIVLLLLLLLLLLSRLLLLYILVGHRLLVGTLGVGQILACGLMVCEILG